MNLFSNCVIIVFLTTILVSGHQLENCLDCDKLEEQIIDGKWKNYNMVLTDCLQRRFFEKSEENVNFYASFSELENSIDRNYRLIEENFEQEEQRLGKLTSSSKRELEIKVLKRKLEKSKQKLRKILEEANIQVVLIEAEIRDTMDRCLRPPRIGIDHSYHIEQCSKNMNEVFVRAKELCEALKAQKVLLEVENLSSHLRFKTLPE